MQEKIIYAIVEIFGMFAIGAALRWRNLLCREDLDRLTKVIFDILFPLLIFSSLYKGLEPKRLYELWTLPVIGLGLMLFGAIFGFALQYGMINKKEGRRETFLHFCAVNNFQFLPLIVIGNLWGDQYTPLLFILNLGSTIGQWTLGIALLGGGCNKQALKNILNPNVYAIIATLLIICLRIPIPDIVIQVAGKAGSAALPMCLLLVGAALFGAAHHLMKDKWDITWLCICRLIILPLLTIWLLKLIPLPKDVYQISFVVGIMPVSVSAAVLTIRYGGSTEFAGQAAVVTTLASIATMPILMKLI